MDRIVAELKQILKKDFNRRMIEGTAYKGKNEHLQGVKLPITNSDLCDSIRNMVG